MKIVSAVQPAGHDPADVPACLQIWLHPLRSARPHLPVAEHHREKRP